MKGSRLSGVVLPLFSIRSRGDWGIGQITDLPRCAAWCRDAGQRLLQVLPPYELAGGETSPYGARTAFGLDPIYVDLDAVPDLDPATIDEALGPEGKARRAELRASHAVRYDDVRVLKGKILGVAFQRFFEREWIRNTPRAEELRRFAGAEASWLEDLALYVALRDAHEGHGWSTWSAPERDRDPQALASLRAAHARRILEVKYGQWLALSQWDQARGKMKALGVELMGDLPFVVGHESADVWARSGQFLGGVSLGAPPDAFAPEGQDWGLPPYDFGAMARDDLAWLRARTRHAARLYDRFRLDHVVGYYRMWIRRPGQPGTFDPGPEHEQHGRGEWVLRAILEAAGASQVIGEDLGVIPDFVRASLSHLGIPGYRVLPWERDHEHRLRDPRQFPEVSLATWSTHDTAPITQWWHDFQDYERRDFARAAGFDEGASVEARDEALLRFLFQSSSSLTLVLAQELLGARDRINTPGTVGPANWTYRLPQTLEDLVAAPAVRVRMARVKALVEGAGRG